VVKRWEFPTIGDTLVFDSQEDAEEYLAAAVCLAGASGSRAKAALQTAMAWLQDEFCHLLIHGAQPLAADDL
jgi:exocyst complex protein 7